MENKLPLLLEIRPAAKVEFEDEEKKTTAMKEVFLKLKRIRF